MSAYSMGYDAGLNAGANMVLQRQFAKEIQENNTIRGACLQELARKDLDNIYYSADTIKNVLRGFYIADRNLDGHVALEELLAAYSPQDEDARQKLVNLFLQVDVTRDQKLSLAEFFIFAFLREDFRDGYSRVKNLELELC